MIVFGKVLGVLLERDELALPFPNGEVHDERVVMLAQFAKRFSRWLFHQCNVLLRFAPAPCSRSNFWMITARRTSLASVVASSSSAKEARYSTIMSALSALIARTVSCSESSTSERAVEFTKSASAAEMVSMVVVFIWNPLTSCHCRSPKKKRAHATDRRSWDMLHRTDR